MAGTITLELTGGSVRPLRMIGGQDLKVVTGRFAFDSSYLTGGESVSPSDFNLSTEITSMVFTPALCSSDAGFRNAIIPTFDFTNSKVVALVVSAGDWGTHFTEATSAADLSEFTARFIAIGY